ncbi:MAG TPA: NAD(P)/FAD-dependent oxidoreductase [Ktedonobacteraceae bacterium]|nr:NAD(P)/FAD-dependent oxidoreductase [Ktedonobacteraceae bacterium]
MARTPLMRALQRLASEHAEADERGVSVEEVRHERQLRISRRDVLKGAGALAAGLALADPLNLAGRLMKADAQSAPRIGIIGGGIAGLNAALTLQDAGYASTIFEASSRLGGRMHSDTTTWANGQTSEWCGELIDTGHKTIQHLAQRFGLQLVDLLQAQPNGSQDTYFFFGQYYLQKDADSDFQQVYKVLKNQIQAAPFPTLYNSYTSTGYQLDHTSLYDWIEQYVTGGHSANMGQLLDVAYNEEYGRETNVQSSLNLVYLLGFQASPGNFSIYGASDERYHIIGGNQQLPQAIANSLPAGSIQMNWKMTAIAVNADGSITVTFSTPNGKRQQTFDRVILALPFSVLRTLDYSKANFDSLKQTAITQLGYGTNSKLQLQFDTRYWNGTGAWPGISDGNIYTDVGFQNTWDVTRGQSGTTGIIVDYTGGNVGASYQPNSPYSTSADPLIQQYAQAFIKQLEEVWPGATQHYTGTATLSYPTGDPNLLGSYACWLVGQYTLFSGYERVRQGKIHFAGEHCSINFQGFMEGGAEEGARAANEILTDYKNGIFP